MASQANTRPRNSIKARLQPMLAAKSFILSPIKLKFDKVWVPLEKYKAEAKKCKEDADNVFLELAKRLKNKNGADAIQPPRAVTLCQVFGVLGGAE
jgi:hypothetical protein